MIEIDETPADREFPVEVRRREVERHLLGDGVGDSFHVITFARARSSRYSTISFVGTGSYRPERTSRIAETLRRPSARFNVS